MRICVFCGSNLGGDPAYAEAARSLARLLVSRRIGIVYGGGSVGLMGVIADAALAAGGEVIGVIPRTLWDREIGHRGLSDLHIVDTMHERKARMAELSDAFIALPGGLGTLEEIFEVWTWAQLGLHQKPCGFLNVNDYFTPLIAFLDRSVESGFVRPQHRGIAFVESDPARMLDQFAAYVPPDVPKWIGQA
jgi:uncharacterized protein (TIGR00730 family)